MSAIAVRGLKLPLTLIKLRLTLVDVAVSAIEF